MLLTGKVVNLLPSEKPDRAIIKLDDWIESFSVPSGHLKIGQRVEIEITPLLTTAARVGHAAKKLFPLVQST